MTQSIHSALAEKGVSIPSPESIYVSPDVDPERISGEGVTLHAGTRLFGAKTLVCKGAEIGGEGPATIDDCQVGPDVQLKGGYFKEAVFLKGAAAGLGAHVREGTVLEESASVAHTVGLKQTILFPFVTLGSLINFCDCLMAGGTGPKNHSEVGSSYIHFNFTPNQDKATPSLIGDVPRGIMLDQPPIFLGGQGGLVGPCRIAFGTVIAAGTINRKDVLEPNLLVFGDGVGKGGRLPYRPGRHSGVVRIIRNNLIFLSNLAALQLWGRHVRSLFLSDDYPEALHEGWMEKVDMALVERVKRLGQFAKKANHIDLQKTMPQIEERFIEKSDHGGEAGIREPFIENIQAVIQRHGLDYLKVLRELSPVQRSLGTDWLSGVVSRAVEIIPSAS